VVGAPAPLGAQVVGAERVRLLALLALRECGARLGTTDPVPLIVCAPALGSLGCDADWLLQRLIADCGLPVEASASVVLELGRDGTPQALALARRLLSSRVWPACVVLAVDSLVVPARLASEVAAGRVAGTRNPTGFVPGEAAAALVLATRAAPGAAAVIAGTGHSGGRSVVLTAAALAQASQRALGAGRVSAAALAAVCHDGAGDWPQLEEVALADGRWPLWAAPQAQRLLPAISVGEVGAAAGVLSLAVLAFLIDKGVLTGPALALFAGTGPTRAAAVLVPPASVGAGGGRRGREAPLLNDGRRSERGRYGGEAPPRRRASKKPPPK
jgi:3-oxoacyl-[acyl-carrier-protein] synthase-1